MSGSFRFLSPVTILLILLLAAGAALARAPMRRAFFTRYPGAIGSVLDSVTSHPGHCGACHFDFAGGGVRNPYGVSLEISLLQGLSRDAALAGAEPLDSDNDGYANLREITDTVHFSDTPTFPGLKENSLFLVLAVNPDDLADRLTPHEPRESDPPDLVLLSPVGGEVIAAEALFTVAWSATDPSGIAGVDIFFSDDDGDHWRQLEQGLANTGSHPVFIPHLPGEAILRVEVEDMAGNRAEAESGEVTVTGRTGLAPTTLRDFDLPGTQPFGGGLAENPAETCLYCHGGYDPEVEPWYAWQGTLMAQAMRDPLYLATLRVAESMVPSVGDLCLRCHTPNGWAEGRSKDTWGSSLSAKDYQGVNCAFCHSLVDPDYVAGSSPAADEDILEDLEQVPGAPANGCFVLDADPARRGPYVLSSSSHMSLGSPFHHESALCGTCHDVSNPVFVRGEGDGTYVLQELDVPHPDGDPRNMFPIERTFSEWSVSAYPGGGVYQPQFAGAKPDGIVSTCQDCHMHDVIGKGAGNTQVPLRTDLAWHDLSGGNAALADILPDFFPGDVDPVLLQAARQRAEAMLSLAATLQVTGENRDFQPGLTVRVTNETGHKLPSGYPEGRRAWLNVKVYDREDNLVFESGHYDPDSGHLDHDPAAKIYEIKPGISTRLSPVLGLPAGPSFHFALNDTVYADNRIPPRGFTNAAFTDVQSPPVAHPYADGQHWDDTHYTLPVTASRAEVVLYYQTTSREYVEFLRDNNTIDSTGQDFYDAWSAHGKSAPTAMAQATVSLDLSAANDGIPQRVTSLAQNFPNPFNPQTFIDFSLATGGDVLLVIYDERGRLVRTLVAGDLPGGPHRIRWDGADDGGRPAASGVYPYVLQAGGELLKRKMTLLR